MHRRRAGVAATERSEVVQPGLLVVVGTVRAAVHGFGEQYNATDQRGEAFELFVSEDRKSVV